MGYSLNEANLMTFNEYNFLRYGYFARCQRDLVGVRKIIATIVNWSGKITDTPIKENEVLDLVLIDNIEHKPVVKSREEAEAIFKTFL